MSKRTPEHPDIFRLRSRAKQNLSRAIMLTFLFLVMAALFAAALWAGWYFGQELGLMAVAVIGGFTFIFIGGYTAMGALSEADNWLRDRHDLAVMRNEYAWKSAEKERKEMRQLLEENGISSKGFLQ